jgi:hypothetical protein
MKTYFKALLIVWFAISNGKASFADGLPKLHKWVAPSDTFNSKRFKLVMAGQSATIGAMLFGLNYAWYKGYPKSAFHLFNDNKEWKQIDKVGHFYSSYAETLVSTGLFQWAGVKPTKAALLGIGIGFGVQLTIEILDGYSAKWGFSLTDITSNTLGTAMVVTQIALWQQQRLQFKFSAHRAIYPNGIITNRVNELYGKSLPERILKDYNGQTYWLSVNVPSFFKGQKVMPPWFNIAVGYGAQNMFGGEQNPAYLTASGAIGSGIATDFYLNPVQYKPYRQFYLSPDIDFTKIKTKSLYVKTFLQVLNMIKLPMPAVEYGTNGRFNAHWLYY